MGMTFEQLDASGEEVDRFIIDCVMKNSWFKPTIISTVAFDFFLYNEYYRSTDVYSDSAQETVENFVKQRFLQLQRLGELKFNKKQSKWVVVLNAEFPTLRSDYTCG